MYIGSLPHVLQEVANWKVKGHLLHAKRLSFAR